MTNKEIQEEFKKGNIRLTKKKQGHERRYQWQYELSIWGRTYEIKTYTSRNLHSKSGGTKLEDFEGPV